MKEIAKQEFQKHGKIIKFHETMRGWAIIIRPDNIRVDNYNKPAHLHVKSKGIHIPIKYQEQEEAGLIIELHLDRNEGLDLKELMKELIWLK